MAEEVTALSDKELDRRIALLEGGTPALKLAPIPSAPLKTSAQPSEDLSPLTDEELDRRIRQFRSETPTQGDPRLILPTILGAKKPPIPENIVPQGRIIAEDFLGDAESLSDRLVASFFNTPEGKRQVIAQRYGLSNTRVVRGEPEYKNPRTGKWTKFDEEGISAADFLDISSDILGMFVSSAATIKGGAEGAVTGTAIGAALPIPGAAPVLGTLGGFIGAVAAGGGAQVTTEGIKRGVQRLFTGKAEPFDILSEAEEGALAELVGRGFTGSLAVGKKIVKKLVRSRPTSREAKEAIKLAEEAIIPGRKKKGIPLTAGQATAFDPKVVRTESFIERFPFSQASTKRESEAVDLFGDLARHDVTSKIGRARTKIETGVLIDNAFKARKIGLRNTAKRLYGEVDRVAGNDRTVAHNAIAEINNVLDDILDTATKAPEVQTALERASASLGKEGGSTLSEISAVRSNMMSTARELRDSVKDKRKAVRWMTFINNALDKDIEAYGQKFGFKAVDKLKEANAVYRKEINEIFSPIVGKLLSRAEAGTLPLEDIVDKIISKGKTGRITPTKQLRALLPKDIFEDIQGYTAQNFLDKATVLGVGNEKIISPGKLRKVIEDFGDDALSAIFPEPEKLKAIKNLSKIGSLFVARGGKELGINPAGTGQALIKTQLALGTLGAVGGLTGGAAGGTEGAVTGATIALFSAPVLSRALQSKPVIKFLTSEGLSPKLERKLADSVRVILIGIMNRERGKKSLAQPTQGFPTPTLRGL